jgi:2-keto-4-pentenoate hydratase
VPPAAPCAPVRTLLPAGDIAVAYAVQAAWVASQVAAGDSVVGRKIGLTNPAVQAQLDDVLAATGSVVAALEIVDSRIAGWDISIVDTVADNASSGLFTLGLERRPPSGLDLSACPMRLCRGDEEMSTGSGAVCLGHPAAAVAWLAATARSYGQPLRAGEIVLSGALGPMVPVQAGDRFTAEIGGLGGVTATFTGSPR